jgi:hypothetical protein
MKTMRLFLLIGILLPVVACNAQDNKSETKASASDKVEAYYFHFSARCMTCKTVEAEAKADFESLYEGKVPFQSVNLEEADGKALAAKLQVTGQSLIIVKGDQKINITNEGFMYARSNPEKFKSIIKEKVDSLL